ncbi:hypothetical protein ACFQ0T_03035 [Kitasatospora gansuensis]
MRAATLVTLARELDTDLDWREQADLGRELDQIGTELGLPGHQWHGRSFQVTSAAASGETAEVRRLIDECAELATSYRMPGPGAVTATMTATLAHLDGRIEASEAEYTRAAALMAGQGSPHAEGYLVVAIATLRATEGLPPSCCRRPGGCSRSSARSWPTCWRSRWPPPGNRPRPAGCWPRRARSGPTTSSRSSRPSARWPW